MKQTMQHAKLKAKADQEYKDLRGVFSKLDDLCREETDLSINDFLEVLKKNTELCHYLSTGPYKKEVTNIEANFQEDSIDDMFNEMTGGMEEGW